jgi:hypothetical protein
MFPNSPYLTKLLVDAHVDELRRTAARSRLARYGSSSCSKRVPISGVARGLRGGIVFSELAQVIKSTTERRRYEREQSTMGEG